METLVHLEVEPGNLPVSYKLLKAEVPDNISQRTVEDSELAPNWRDDLVLTRTIGDQWLGAGVTGLLKAPSVVVPDSFNFLLNPRHADAPGVRILWHRDYPWDQRLL